MYPRTKDLIIIVISIIIYSCSSLSKSGLDESARNIESSVFLHDIYTGKHIPFSCIYIDKAQFRLDYNGQLRSLKASYGYKIDSFLYVNLKTTFGKSVASFIAREDLVIFEDYQVGRVYLLDYATLSELTSIPINFRFLQKIFIASYNLEEKQVDFINSDSLNMEFSVFKNTQIVNDTLSVREILTFSVAPLFIQSWEVHTQSSEKTLNSSYRWKESFSHFHPKYIDISFTYAESPIEIEFDFRSVFHDSLVHFTLDTTLLPETILLSE